MKPALSLCARVRESVRVHTCALKRAHVRVEFCVYPIDPLLIPAMCVQYARVHLMHII